jgi:hypothetical protein
VRLRFCRVFSVVKAGKLGRYRILHSASIGTERKKNQFDLQSINK